MSLESCINYFSNVSPSINSTFRIKGIGVCERRTLPLHDFPHICPVLEIAVSRRSIFGAHIFRISPSLYSLIINTSFDILYIYGVGRTLRTSLHKAYICTYMMLVSRIEIHIQSNLFLRPDLLEVSKCRPLFTCWRRKPSLWRT